MCFGQSPPPVLLPTATPAPGPSLLQFIQNNWALIVLFLKSFADFLFARNPKLDAPGGVVDFVYLYLKNYGKPPKV